jgi:hypothetical protein
MTREEAKTCVLQIRSHINVARRLILELYDLQGWKALGYTSWRQCVLEEFGQSSSYLYRQLEAAKIESDISSSDQIGSIPDSQLRCFKSVPRERRKELWNQVKKGAIGGIVTAKMIQEELLLLGFTSFFKKPNEPLYPEVGWFYLIDLDPVSCPKRVKFGFTNDLDLRLLNHRTTNPTALVVGFWHCIKRWEATAIDSATRSDCTLCGGEVYEIVNLELIVGRLATFFSNLPALGNYSGAHSLGTRFVCSIFDRR